MIFGVDALGELVQRPGGDTIGHPFFEIGIRHGWKQERYLPYSEDGFRSFIQSKEGAVVHISTRGLKIPHLQYILYVLLRNVKRRGFSMVLASRGRETFGARSCFAGGVGEGGVDLPMDRPRRKAARRKKKGTARFICLFDSIMELWVSVKVG